MDTCVKHLFVFSVQDKLLGAIALLLCYPFWIFHLRHLRHFSFYANKIEFGGRDNIFL